MSPEAAVRIEARKRKYAASTRAAHYKVINDIKLANGCVDCGYKDHPAALDFDHVRGIKLFAVATGFRTKPWSAVLEGIDKCEVRCSNCHRVKTAERRDKNKALVVNCG